jgi:hypothetical protein
MPHGMQAACSPVFFQSEQGLPLANNPISLHFCFAPSGKVSRFFNRGGFNVRRRNVHGNFLCSSTEE